MASCTVLFLNLSPNTFLGIDFLSFNSSPNFHGITNIPSGLHFLYSGADASLAIRHGRWMKVPSSITTPTLYVYKWNAAYELLDLCEPQSSEALAATSAIPTLRKSGLIDYSALEGAISDARGKGDSQSTSDVSDWPRLTSYISGTTLSRALSPVWTITSVSCSPEDAEQIPGLSEQESSSVLKQLEEDEASSVLNFVPVNLKQTWPDDAIGRERTEKARDRSWYLGHILDSLASEKEMGDHSGRQDGAKELLGELQLCFVMVLTLANYSCLEQWKRILSVILTCQSAIEQIEEYFVQVLELLKTQMRHVEDVDGGLFDLKDETSSKWLRQLIGRFRASVEEVATEEGNRKGNEAKKKLEEFEGFMREVYGWESGRDVLKRGMLDLEDGERVEMTMDGADEDEEEGEYAPVVVDM